MDQFIVNFAGTMALVGGLTIAFLAGLFLSRLNVKSLVLHLRERNQSLESKMKELEKKYEFSVRIFHEEKAVDGFFRKSHQVTVYSQPYVGEFPVGGRLLVKQDIYWAVKEENVKKCIESVVSPLLDSGIKVLLAAV